MKYKLAPFIIIVMAALMIISSYSTTNPLVYEASLSVDHSVEFFHSLSVNGGYVYYYSTDLDQRLGELREAAEREIWVEPPGTTSVGLAFLEVYRVTSNPEALLAAEEAGDALIEGQLVSGGWGHSIDFDQEQRRSWCYRTMENSNTFKDCKNTSSFDNNNSQSALRLIMELDLATGKERYHEVAMYALQFMLKSQYANGAWPQAYPVPPDYRSYYTFNDGVINDCISGMIRAHEVYGTVEYLESATRGGDFIILSQLDSGGWAQQYNYEMEPSWARKFEPPATCSSCTARNIATLVDLYLATGDSRFLQPLPRAIQWLEDSSVLPNLWARFYDCQTNQPLFINKEYSIIYDASDALPAYQWKGKWDISAIISYYQTVKSIGRSQWLIEQHRPYSMSSIVKWYRRVSATLSVDNALVHEGFSLEKALRKFADTRLIESLVRAIINSKIWKELGKRGIDFLSYLDQECVDIDQIHRTRKDVRFLGYLGYRRVGKHGA